MASQDLSCPICSADLALSGEEEAGDEVICTYCGSPCKLRLRHGSDSLSVVEDF